MNPTPTTQVYITCPVCQERNLLGDDLCWSCQASLTDLELPTFADPLKESELELNRPLSALRLRKATTVRHTATVAEAIEVLRKDSSGAVLVMDGLSIAGIFSERDVLMRVAGRDGMMDRPVTSVMTPDPVKLDTNDRMNVVINKMGVGGFRHVPVVNDGDVVGMVDARDVVRWLLLQYFG